MVDIKENVDAAIEAMIGGNRIQFADNISAILHAKATEAVEARREELAQSIFNYADEEVEEEIPADETLIAEPESEETVEVEEPTEE